ncbi:MAG: type II toxin-antitoxin system HicA family toxin [Bacteroidales bacterium]|nr:type II toxin-antitoxin system HicA family toxin [Bacteroidales bacterium]
MSYKTVKDVVDLLLANDFSFVRQKGSHQVYTNGKKVVIVPNHGKKGIEKGTYFSILRQAGLKK